MAAKTALVTCILISIQHETSAGIALCLDNCVQLSQLSFSHGCTILCPHPDYKRASFPPPPYGHRLLSVFTTAIPVGVKWISLWFWCVRSVGDPLPDTLRIPRGITDIDHEDQRRDCEARGSSKSVANVFFTFSIAYFFRETLMQNPCSFLKNVVI